MSDNNDLKIEKYVLNILENIKASMPYYRILKVSDGSVLLEQVHTKRQSVMTIEDLYHAINPYDKSPIALTNPSLLKDKMPKDDYKCLLSCNTRNTYVIDEKDSTKKLLRLVVLDESNEKTPSGRDVYVRDLIKMTENGLGYAITNPMVLKDYLIDYYKNFDKQYIFNYIKDSLMITFSDYEIILPNNGNQESEDTFKFALKESSNKTDKATVIRLKREDNNVYVTGKRNNNKLENKYFIGRVGKDYYKLNMLILKMHIDICNELRMTPFRFMTSYNFLSKCINNWNSNTHYNPYYAVINRDKFKREKEIEEGKEVSQAMFEVSIFLRTNKRDLAKKILIYRDIFKVTLSQELAKRILCCNIWDIADESDGRFRDGAKRLSLLKITCRSEKSRTYGSFYITDVFDSIFECLKPEFDANYMKFLGVKRELGEALDDLHYWTSTMGFRRYCYNSYGRLGYIDLKPNGGNRYTMEMYERTDLEPEKYKLIQKKELTIDIPENATKEEITKILEGSYINKGAQLLDEKLKNKKS